MGGRMSQIIPGIYVGGLSSAKSQSQLDENGITHLCSVIGDGVNLDSTRKQIVLRADDSPDENLSRYFEDAVFFIHEARVSGGSVLIHCACGVSRSVTITLAYLLVVTDFSLSDLLKAVEGARHCACPNYGFRKQLHDFEESKGHVQIRERLFSRFGQWSEANRETDAAELKEHLSAQEYFIMNGVYPGEESLERAERNEPRRLPGFFTVHTRSGPQELNDFISLRVPPTDVTEANEASTDA